MKKLLLLLILCSSISTASYAQRGGGRGGGHSSSSSHSSGSRSSGSGGGVVHVRGYTRKDGTYVAPHDRTAPNDTKLDNWSTKGNVNPETGEPGTKDPYPENRSGSTSVGSLDRGPDASGPLRNEDVLQMVKDGLTADEVKKVVLEAQSSFDTSAPALRELKKAGVPDEIITAMVTAAISGAEASHKSENSTGEASVPTSVNGKTPEVRGFRLGMPMSQVLSRFRRNPPVIDLGFGLSVLRVYPSIYATNGDDFKGVEQMAFEFTDQTLSSINVKYDGSVRWASAREFCEKVVQGLGLPPMANSDIVGDTYSHIFDGFVVEIEYNYGIMPQVHIFNPDAAKLVGKRRAEDELKKRQSFRP